MSKDIPPPKNINKQNTFDKKLPIVATRFPMPPVKPPKPEKTEKK